MVSITISQSNCTPESTTAQPESPTTQEDSNSQTFPRLYHDREPYVCSFDQYKAMYEESVHNPESFWTQQAKELLTWRHPFTSALHGSLLNGDVSWFSDGEVNACYNMVDRHAYKTPDKIAIMFEADEPNCGRNLSYSQLLRQVCQLAGLLKARGVRKGDTVAIYMPMIPEVVVAMLACSRIGAVHSVVFAGFSSESLRDRILDADSKIVITANEGRRGGRLIPTKQTVDDAISICPEGQVTSVIVYRNTPTEVTMLEGRDLCWETELIKFPGYCPCTNMSAEDPLFILYTSGSTGTPKGVMHTTGGYLVGAACTTKYVFDVHPDDRVGCVGDVGWITGHTYIVYGPLLLGASTLVFEGTPTYPTASRYWEIVEKHQITQFYCAPTAIRLLARLGDDHVKADRSSLRVLGSVGEPIAPETYKWYQEVVGGGECAVVDTYWQTETGSHAITALPAAITVKPGSATLPFFGIVPAILDPYSGEELTDTEVEGVLTFKQSWPSMARSVWRNHDRFLDTYLRPYPGYYFTGDGAGRDKDGYYWIRGRVDDVINVSGHRLSTAEIEAAIIQQEAVAESAVVGVADEVSGQAINAFVLLKPGYDSNDELKQKIIQQVRKSIGPFATPKQIFFSDLPKTRSGKIMRRILRKVVDGEHHALGDISTLADPSVVRDIIQSVHMAREVMHNIGHTQ